MGLTQNLGRLSPSIFSDASLNIGVGAAPSGSYKFEVTGTSKVSGVLTLGSTLSNGTYTYTLPSATGTLALVGGAGVGTVTSVAALTLGTTGTDLSSTVANSTTTPVITLNVPTASAANRGALSSADWSTFNSKQGTITLTTTGTSGAATFSANTLNIPNYGSALSGYVPYTGATANLDLGAFSLTTFGVSSTNTISTTAGYGILSGGGGFSIGPSATRGIIAINGSGDQLLTFSTQSYIYNSSSLFRMLSSSDIDFVAGGTQRLLISASTGAATFSSSVTTNANFINSGPVYSTTGNVGNLLFTNTYPSNYNVAQIASVLDGYFYAAKLVFRTADSANANLLVDRLTIASSGAATFSSNVNVNTYLSLGTGSGKFLAVGGAVTAGSSADILMYNTGGDIYFWATGAVGMIIKATSGNVGIGTVGPSYKLHIEDYTSSPILFVGGSNTNGVSNAIILLQSGRIPQSGSDTTGTAGLLFQQTISGGTIVNGGYIYNIRENVFGATGDVNTAITFATTIANVNNERMRITSGGSLLIGTTSGGNERFNVTQSGANWAQAINHTNSTQFFMDLRYNGTQTGSIIGSGGVTSYNVTSDYRLKEDFKNYNGLELISKIKTYDFEFKQSKLRMYGVIAHELQEVIPYAVFGEKDAEQMQQVDYSKIVPVLVKAIQEQQAQIEELKQIVAIK